MNIYLLKQELLSIYDELEESGGELTDELSTQLTINAEDVKNNIKDYVNLTKLIASEINDISYEQKRLKELADRKNKVLERINKIILEAVDFFGNEKSNGVKFIDYGTGIVSTRKTSAVEVNDESVKAVGIALKELLEWNHSTNSLGESDKIDEQELLNWVSEDVEKNDGTKVAGVSLTDRDLDAIKVNLNFNVPLRDLVCGRSYSVIRSILEDNLVLDVSTKVDKKDAKNVLKNDSEAYPNIAKIVERKTLVVK